MAEKLIRGHLQGARMAVECGLPWEFQLKVEGAIAAPDTPSACSFRPVGHAHSASLDQANAHTLMGGAVIDLTRSKRDLMLENALLRQQLIVIERQIKRPMLTWRDRALFVGLSSRLKGWKETLRIVKPETVLRWHRDLFGWVWRRKSRAKVPVGRPALASEKVALIRRLAKENIMWGTERIRGELLKLGLLGHRQKSDQRQRFPPFDIDGLTRIFDTRRTEQKYAESGRHPLFL